MFAADKEYPDDPSGLDRAVPQGPRVNPLLQLGVALTLVAICSLLHAGGLAAISWLFNLEDEELKRQRLDFGTVWMIVVIALSIFILHIAEIALFAGFYCLVESVHTVEEAIYYSAAAYTTAGNGIERLGTGWRLLATSESLAGFLLSGWSTAYLVQKLRKLGEEPKRPSSRPRAASSRSSAKSSRASAAKADR